MAITIKEKIVKNTLFNTLGHFWVILVALFLTPYIISHIGIERYGIWAIVGVLTGYFDLLDFGIGTSFVKYISEYYAKNDYKKINQIVNTGFIFYSIFAVLIVLLGFSIIGLLLKSFNVPQGLYEEAVFVFLLGIIIFGASNALSVFVAIQGGLQRMEISNIVVVVMSVPNIVGTIFFLERDYGLSGLMINNAIILVISSIANIIIAFKILPELRFNPFLFSREMFKRLFSFGVKLQFAKIADNITFQTDKILIAYFLNVSYVGFYQLGSSITSKMRGLPLLLISALLPAASEMNAFNEREKLHELYLRGTKYLSAVSIPLVFFVIISAHLIMLAWIGKGYEKSAWIIQLLGIGYLVNILAGVGVTIASAMGKPEFQMKAAIITATSNLILSIILIIKFGFIGVAIATSISLVLGPIYFFVKLHQQIRLPLIDFMKKTILKPLLISFLVAMLIYGLNYGIKPLIIAANRPTIISIFFLEGAFFVSIYTIIILKVKHFNWHDINYFKESISFVTKYFKSAI